MKHFKEDEFLSDVSDICWEHFFQQTDDINKLVDDWSILFALIIEKHAPLREMRLSEKYCPWINKDLKSLMQTRDRLKKAALKSKSTVLMDSYRQARNKVNSVNIKLKKQYFSTKISECRGNMKESWKTINEVLNKRSKSCNIDCIKDSGNAIVNKKDISNAMNSFFCTIGEKLASKIDATPNPLLSGGLTERGNNFQFQFQTIGVQEIRDAIAKTKTSKSFGSDSISCYFLKLALPFIENSLACLFNTSLETSQFPDSWKLARVTPIFKEGDKAEKSNYRPISVLPVISRLFEKLVANQLYQHIYDNGYFSSEQSGFLRLHSTVTCLLKNTDDWYNGLDLGKLVALVFIDLKKAFDTVDHGILCKKLEYYGIQERQLAWFKSYLANRKQFSRVNGIDSKVEEINVGVPQGSCLGPLLFLIYINDLPRSVPGSRVSMYADDTSICHQSFDIAQMNEAINSDLAKVEKWLKGNKLSLNVTKTHAMLVSTKPKHKTLKNQGESLKLKFGMMSSMLCKKQNILGCRWTTSWIGRNTLKQFPQRSQGQLAF